jgi:hypothetical protein
LAAAVSEFRKQDRLKIITDRLCLAAIILACLMTTGYCAGKIIAARREHRDAFAVFGRDVVKTAAAHGWRYSLVGGEDEGMALYVRRTEFIEPDQAASEWNAGKVDALVVPDDEIAELIPRLQGGEPKRRLTSKQAGRYKKHYFLLVRPSSPQ